MPKLLATSGAVVVLLTMGCGAPPGNDAESAASAARSVGATRQGPVEVGQPTRDGGLEFVVTGVACGQQQIGLEPAVVARGEYCLVSIAVRNVGREPQLFSDASQRAYAGGTEFSPDVNAGLYANRDAAGFLNGMRAGESVTAEVVFDVPRGTRLTYLRLRASGTSRGVLVVL